MSNKNIVLIGMPSSGKSTIGSFLAKKLNLQFIDIDTLIFDKAKKPLKDIVEQDGLKRFLELQEEVVIKLIPWNSVIATGGSVVYSQLSMNHLKEKGIVVYLKLNYNDLKKRIRDGRRFAKNKEQSFFDLYSERVPLYEKYADFVVDCSGKKVEEIAKEIEELYI